MLVLKIKTRPRYKPWFPPDRASSQLTIEEEKQRGEAGDPLLLGQMEAQSKMPMNPKEEHRLWMEETQRNENGAEIIVKKPHNLHSTANSPMRVLPKEAGFVAIGNLYLQHRYDLMEDIVTGFIPPTKEGAKKIIQESTKDKKNKIPAEAVDDWAIKTIDAFNEYFIGLHNNIPGTWNTVLHLPNLEHREFYRVLDDDKLKCKLQVTCYQKYWHTEKGNFVGEKYVSLLWCI